MQIHTGFSVYSVCSVVKAILRLSVTQERKPGKPRPRGPGASGKVQAMRMPRMPKGNNGGFTLVELLVVILIIVILSVTMLPLLKPFVTKAQFAAEGVPVIGNLRTKVELFRIEKNYLPGVPTANNVPVKYGSDTNAYTWSNLTINDLTLTLGAPTTANIGECVQTLLASNTTDKTVYYHKSGTVELNNLDGAARTGYRLSDHVFKRIDVNYADLTGKRLRPHHMRYAVLGNRGESYLWVVACFGDGDGLEAGCGYAVAEFNDVSNQRKFVATFERYKPLSSAALSIISDFNSSRSPGSTVWLPAFEALIPLGGLGLDGYNRLLEGMRTSGWDVN
jgi:prepilin-type N-terminal cleavage/methylation domain-containing protein